MLERLSCIKSDESCVVRSAIQCYLPSARQYVNCGDYYTADAGAWKPTYTMCGEHDVFFEIVD